MLDLFGREPRLCPVMAMKSCMISSLVSMTVMHRGFRGLYGLSRSPSARATLSWTRRERMTLPEAMASGPVCFPEEPPGSLRTQQRSQRGRQAERTAVKQDRQDTDPTST